MINHGTMKYLPIQSRGDVGTQIELDGPLLAGNGKNQVSSYASSDQPARL
jgi:hypothetical protein